MSNPLGLILRPYLEIGTRYVTAEHYEFIAVTREAAMLVKRSAREIQEAAEVFYAELRRGQP
ncbi:MAG: hypothetical protein DCC49_10530 [Acidobacteria bacterium]|nr:MAG: hypothetical protein DCC49_10530 [Acidobacteriota bacterium]